MDNPIENNSKNVEDIKSKLLHLVNDTNKLDLLREEKALLIRTIEHILPMQENMKLLQSMGTNTLKELNKCTNKLAGILEEQVKEKQQYDNHEYVVRLKFTAKIYSKFNEKLSADLETLKKQFAYSQSQINGYITSKEEINQMEAKILQYDGQLMKLEKRNPWLKDPEFKLPNIMAELHKLENLTQQRDNLLNELEVYKGLKPDINEARLQLNLIKLQYEKMQE